MAFRTQRQKRYTMLRDKGLLQFEAAALSKVKPRDCPYYYTMVRARSAIHNRAIRESWSKARYEKHIKSIYRRKGWTALTRTGTEKFSAWAMLRYYEDKWKDRHPDWKSPTVKKQKEWRDFRRKQERQRRELARSSQAHPGLKRKR